MELRHEELIKEIKGEDGQVASVVTTKGKEMPCQVVGYAIGAIPATAVLAGSGMKMDKGVLVDDKLRTNFPNVYAAGDVAQALDLVHGDYRVNTSVANAQAQGEVAGSNMAGVEQSFRGAVPSNTMQIYGIELHLHGHRHPARSGLRGDHRPVSQGRRLQEAGAQGRQAGGAVLLGEIGESRAAQELIARGATCRP